jgi:predicted transcriptional regulator
MKKKMSDKKKLMAYVLNKDDEFNCSMTNISNLLGVSQSTISTSVKEIGLKKRIMNLENELGETKKLLINNKNLQIENKLISPVKFIAEDDEF